MSISTKKQRLPIAAATGLVLGDEYFTVCLLDGRRIAVPYCCYPRLARATAQQRRHFEVCGQGRLLHWPEIDEDIEVQHLVEGRMPVKEDALHMVVAEGRMEYGKKRMKAVG